MTQHSKYIYVYYRELMGFVFCGLMDGPSKEYVEAQIRQMDPHATAIRVNDANDTRPAEPVYGSDYSSDDVKAYIYCFQDSATGALACGLEVEPSFHPEIKREMIQHYYPGARGIIVEEVSDEEYPYAKTMRAKYKSFRLRMQRGNR